MSSLDHASLFSEASIGCIYSIASYLIASEVSFASQAFLSRYSALGPASAIFLGVEIARDPEHWAGACAGFASSILTGVKIGLMCNGIIGSIAGAVIGSLVGYCISRFFNKMQDDYKTGSGIFAPRSPGERNIRRGGNEFRSVSPIKGFTEANIVLSRKCNIYFETEDEKLTREAFNSICDPKFHNKKIQEYFHTIVSEIFEGKYFDENIPFVSLHYNEKGLLYPVINPYYKRTIVGNALIYLDYFLKGFINGGFYDIQFVKNWKFNDDIDVSELNQNLIDIRLVLKGIKPGYRSLYSLLNQDRYGNEFSSEFRLINFLLQTCQVSDHNMFPDSDFLVEVDLYPDPVFKKMMSQDPGAAAQWAKIQNAHNLMKLKIKEFMTLVPQFKGYFQILKMICFAIRYVESLDSVGLRAETNLSFRNQDQLYVDKLPDFFPILPVCNSIRVDPELKLEEIITSFKETQFDSELLLIMEGKMTDFNQQTYKDMVDCICKFYREKIKAKSLTLNLPYKLDDDDDLDLPRIKLASRKWIEQFRDILPQIFSNRFCYLINYAKQVIDRFNLRNKFGRKDLQFRKVEELNLTLPELRQKYKTISDKVGTYSNIDKYYEGIKDLYLHFSQVDSKNICYQYFSDFLATPLPFTIAIPTPVIENEVNNSIRGGFSFRNATPCTLINRELPLNEKQAIETNVESQNDYIKVQGKDGFLVNFNLVPYYYSQTTVEKDALDNDIKNMLDKNGLSMKQLCLMNGVVEKQFSDSPLNDKSPNNVYSVNAPCADGNIRIIDYFVEKGQDFGEIQFNGLYPFLEIVQNGNHQATKHILSNPSAKIIQIDKATETGITPLHWAVYYGWDDVVKQLVSRGASIESTIKKNGMTPAHLACFHDQPQCLSVLMTNSHFSNEVSDAGYSPLHVAAAHSPSCAYLLIENIGSFNTYIMQATDPEKHSSRDIAILNGQYYIAKLLPKESQTIKFVDELEFKTKLHSFDISNLMDAFSLTDLQITNKTLKKFKETNQKLEPDSYEKLIDCACKGRCTEYVELLSTIIPLDKCPIAIKTAHHGIINWLSELKKFGANFNDQDYGFLDEAIINGDDEFLKEALDIVDKVPESVWRRIVKKAVTFDNEKVMSVLQNCLALNEKYSDVQLMAEDVITSKTNFASFLHFVEFVDPDSLEVLTDFIDFISVSFLQDLMRYKNYSDEQLKDSVIRACQNERFDIAYLILNEFPDLRKELQLDEENQIINNLTNQNFQIAQSNIQKILISPQISKNSANIKTLQYLLNQTFNIGKLKVQDEKSLLELAGTDLKYLWILEVLPDRYVSEFCFDKDYSFEEECASTFSMLFEILQKRFGQQAGSLFLNSFRQLDFSSIDAVGAGDDFVNNLLSVMIENNNNERDYYIKSVDDQRQTLFHIAARFINISPATFGALMSNLEEAISSWSDLLNAKTRKGETVLMVYATSVNFVAIQQLESMGFDIKTRDTHGKNVLHKILKESYVESEGLIEGIAGIIKNHRELIIQYTRKGKNVFYAAAKKGFNGILGILSMFYPVEVLDKLNENCNTSALHIATQRNHYETVRYLVQNLHLDINIRKLDYIGLTPIHIAAANNSLESFKEIIKLGGNPLIEDYFENNAFFYALKFGSEFMIYEIMKFSSFTVELASPSILIPIVQNKQAASIFSLISHLVDSSATRKCDNEGLSLLSLAVQSDNRRIVNELLLMGVDPSKPAKNGQNSIHICAENNNIGCSTLILKYLLLTKGVDEIAKILNAPDAKGNFPIHIAAGKGYDGFVAHLLSSCNKINLDKENYDGHHPANLAQLNGHRKAAEIINNYLINKECGPDKVTNPESLEIINRINSCSNEYDKVETIDIKNQNIEKSFTDVFVDEMKKREIIVNPDVLSKFYVVFNSGIFNTKLIMLVEEGHKEFVHNLLEKMFYQKPNRINFIAYLMILPRISKDELESFTKCLTTLNSLNISRKHPLYSWIENGLISAVELRSDSSPMMQSVETVVQFADRIFNKTKLRKIINYPRLPLPVHVIAKWLMTNFDDSWLYVQLQFMDYVKMSTFMENSQTLSIDFCNRLEDKQYELFNFIMNGTVQTLDRSKNVKEYIVHAIRATLEIYNDPEIQDDVRENLINKCIELANKEQFSPKSLTKWSLLTRRIIKDFDVSYLNEYLENIPQKSLDMANHALSLILNIGSPDQVSIPLIKDGIEKLEEKAKDVEKAKFVENRSLTEILSSFRKKDTPFIPYKFAFDGTPIVELSQKDRDNLLIFGTILEKGVELKGTLAETAKEAGIKFNRNPTIQNAAELVAIVRFAIQDTLKLKPFVIQCLAVGALLLHRVNQNPKLKGRIAQIATGEGKSIIVAMLASSVALTGNFVDVISSSSYLAKRDAEKFDEFYDKLGLSCGTINDKDHLPNVDYNIIYSTNTGFEFAFLFEGISGKKSLTAVPLYCNLTMQRMPMTAIVDEADNLFIDTVKNSARIASGSSSQHKWIFAPLYQAVNNSKSMNVFGARVFLNSIATTPDEKESLNDLSDHQLKRWIENAKFAKNGLKRDVNYIVGFNQEEKKYEIQIVDHENTGRINFGSRWTEGLHEFVEVKEGIQVKSQSLTIAAISHPSFFGRYKEIYGLTGTLGDITERAEIEEMYKIDTFDVPPNRKCLRKRIETLIVKTDEQKHEIIIDKIREITSSQRPILVIVKSIIESQQLSDKLNEKRIHHYLLNDTQVEDEDFIVDRAGICGAVTIATNTAGRGTDIRPEKMAVANGGLHVILAFLPINMRVECQGLGRAGRQGQPGSCQIIFSDPKYARQNPVATDDVLKAVYQKLHDDVGTESKSRIHHTQREHRIFVILSKFFDYIYNMRQFLESPQGEQLVSALSSKNTGNQFDSESILNDLSFKWSEFYTRLSNGDIELSDDLFEQFKNKFEEDQKELAAAFKDYMENPDISKGSCSVEGISPDNYGGSFSLDFYSGSPSIDANANPSTNKNTNPSNDEGSEEEFY